MKCLDLFLFRLKHKEKKTNYTLCNQKFLKLWRNHLSSSVGENSQYKTHARLNILYAVISCSKVVPTHAFLRQWKDDFVAILDNDQPITILFLLFLLAKL